MASSKRWFVLGSLLLHAGLGIGVFASGVWNIERLDGNIRSSSSFAVILPPMPAPAGSPKLAEVKLERKQKPVVKVVVQPPIKPDDTKPADATSTIAGTGEGSGSGSGSGSAGDTGECQTDCGPGSAAPPAKPPVVEPPKQEDTFVPPNVLKMMRRTGSTQIHPTEVTKNQMLHEGRTQTIGIAKVCVSETGAVTHVSMLQSTKYPAYDARLIDGIKTWTYNPYSTKGRNVKVCGTVTFVYGMK